MGKQFSEENGNGCLTRIGCGAPVDPEAKKARIKSDLRMLDIEQKMFEGFIRWLDLSGKISEQPLVNYLHALRPGF